MFSSKLGLSSSPKTAATTKDTMAEENVMLKKKIAALEAKLQAAETTAKSSGKDDDDVSDFEKEVARFLKKRGNRNFYQLLNGLLSNPLMEVSIGQINDLFEEAYDEAEEKNLATGCAKAAADFQLMIQKLPEFLGKYQQMVKDVSVTKKMVSEIYQALAQEEEPAQPAPTPHQSGTPTNK